jgi:hypothetical protein
MAVNLVSLVSQFLTPELIGRIASALGLDQSVAQKAIGASVPAVLAGLAGLVSQPGGAQRLSNALARQPADVVGNLTKALGGTGQQAFENTGSSLLSGLLGSGQTNELTSAIGRFAGIGGEASKSLTGMLAPLVLGALGQQQRSTGMDASGLAAMFASQKDQIASAIPSGLADRLSNAVNTIDGGIRGGTAAAADAAGWAGRTADHTIAGASQAAYGMSGTTSRPMWPYWLLILAALGALGWYFLPSTDVNKVAERATPMADRPGATVGLAPSNLTAGGVDLANQLGTSLGSLRTALAGITDTASAEAALPKIQDAKAQLDKISSLANQLPPDTRKTFGTLVKAAMPAVTNLCDKVLAIPGASTVAKPAIDQIRTQLDTLAET